MNTILERPPALSVEYPPYTPSDEERDQLTKALARLDHYQALLDQAADLKGHMQDSIKLLLHDEASLATIAPMLWAASDVGRRQEMAAAVRGPVKAAMRSVLASVKPVFDAAQKSQADYLRKLCRTTEAAERKSWEKAGQHQDDFEPSRFLSSLRETLRRLQENPSQPSHAAIRKFLQA